VYWSFPRGQVPNNMDPMEEQDQSKDGLKVKRMGPEESWAENHKINCYGIGWLDFFSYFEIGQELRAKGMMGGMEMVRVARASFSFPL